MIKGRFSTSGLHCSTVEQFNDFFAHETGDPKQNLVARLRKYHNAKHVILFSSGFWALVIAIKSQIRSRKKRGVLMPSLTYRRLADAVFLAGGIPIFCEVSKDELALKYESISDLIKSRDDVGMLLFVQPMVGSVCLNNFIELCNDADIGLVVDSVESVHDTIKGQRTGSFNTSEIFSLHASKLINGFEGGYLTTNSDIEASKIKKLSEVSSRYDLSISPFHATIASCNLMNIDEFICHNKTIYHSYIDEVTELFGANVLIKKFDEKEMCGYKNIVVELKNISKDAAEISQHLNDKGIDSRPHYQPPLHLKNHKFETRIAQPLDFTESIGRSLLNLPCGWRFSENSITYVCKLLGEILHDG